MLHRNKEQKYKNFATISGDIVEVFPVRTTREGVRVVNFSVETHTRDEASGRILHVIHHCSLFGDEADNFADNERDYDSIEVEGQLRGVKFESTNVRNVSRSEILVERYKLFGKNTSHELPPSRVVQG